MTMSGFLPGLRSRLVIWGLTTSGGMIGLIVSMLGGVLTGVFGLIAGASAGWAVWIGVAGAVVVIGLLVLVIAPRIPRQQAALTVLFPSTEEPPVAESAE